MRFKYTEEELAQIIQETPGEENDLVADLAQELLRIQSIRGHLVERGHVINQLQTAVHGSKKRTGYLYKQIDILMQTIELLTETVGERGRTVDKAVEDLLIRSSELEYSRDLSGALAKDYFNAASVIIKNFLGRQDRRDRKREKVECVS